MSARIRRITGTLGIGALLLGATSCGNVAQQGRSPSLLVIDTLEAASGASPGLLGVPLSSDVQTLVQVQVNGLPVTVATFYNDVGRAQMRIMLKDLETLATPRSPPVSTR